MKKARIIGTGRALPNKKVHNTDLEKIVETSDQWIKERSGIETRYISTGETTTELAYSAAEKAIINSNINKEEVDLVIVATVSPDSYAPATACVIAKKLGLKNPTAFDLTAGCSGFVYGLTVAKQFIENGNVKNALIVGVEVLSKLVNWKDRGTCVLFGDGAGACILSASDKNGIINTFTGSDGDVNNLLHIPGEPLDNPFYKEENPLPSKISMEGSEIFKFATRIIKKSVKTVLKDSNYTVAQLNHIVPHQANLRIIEYASEKLKIDLDKFYVNLDHCGNTSAASIPIALDEMNEKGLLKENDLIFLVGFGGGLTWGAALLSW